MQMCTWKDIAELVEKIDISNEVLNASNLVLFGAGMYGSFAYERIKNNHAVYGFSDNGSCFKEGSKFYQGVPVIKPEELKNIERIFVIITVTGQHCSAIKKQLQALQIPHITYMEYILKNHLEKFESVYQEMLEDECSKNTYLSILMSHLTCSTVFLQDVFVRNQYFEVPEFYNISAQEIFVDCGAYVGDTMENFVVNRSGIFKKIYSFEPTEKTYKALCVRRERLIGEWALNEEQIIAEKKIVSSNNEFQSFAYDAKGETTNRIVRESALVSEVVESVSLDRYFSDKEEKPTFIKADIEGSELDLIHGSQGIISNNHPLLSICIYHRAEDLYEIPFKLKQLYPEYRMAVRHHMPNYYETVLYCY